MRKKILEIFVVYIADFVISLYFILKYLQIPFHFEIVFSFLVYGYLICINLYSLITFLYLKRVYVYVKEVVSLIQRKEETLTEDDIHAYYFVIKNFTSKMFSQILEIKSFVFWFSIIGDLTVIVSISLISPIWATLLGIFYMCTKYTFHSFVSFVKENKEIIETFFKHINSEEFSDLRSMK
jgi:hypothetical protein